MAIDMTKHEIRLSVWVGAAIFAYVLNLFLNH